MALPQGFEPIESNSAIPEGFEPIEESAPIAKQLDTNLPAGFEPISAKTLPAGFEPIESGDSGIDALGIAKKIMFPTMGANLLDPSRIGKVGATLLAAKEGAIGSIAQLPRFMQESQRSLSEDVPSMQMDILEGLGINVPEKVKQAHQKFMETSIEAINPMSGIATVMDTAETIPALKRRNDEIEKFAVDKIKNSEVIRNGMMEHKESVGQLLKEGRVVDLSEKMADLALAEAPNLAIQAIIAYFTKGGSLAYMGTTAASRKYGSLAEEDVTPLQRVGNALGTGLTEYFSEKLGTGRVLDKAMSGKMMTAGAKKVKEIVFDSMGGAVSEGLASVGENALDILVGMDASLGDGVAESLILGAMFDGGTSVAGQMNTARKVDKFRAGLIASGATEQEANSLIERSQKMNNVKEQREIDTEIGEILKRNRTDSNNDMRQEALTARADILLRQETLSPEERAELGEILENVNAVDSSEIEGKMLRKDIHNIARENGFAIHPRDISRTTTEAELKETIDALEELYGYRPSKKQILDAFHDPMQKVKIETEQQKEAQKERQLTELEEKVKQQRAGEISGDELLKFMEEVNPDMAREFTERTTGENQERPNDVIKDILKNQRETQNGSERKQTIGAEQETVTGQESVTADQTEQGATVQDAGAAEKGVAEELNGTTSKTRLFHGTNEKFNKFGRMGDRLTSLGLGHYFSTNREKSTQYGDTIKEIDLDMSQILDWNNLSESDRSEIIKRLDSIVPDDRKAGFGEVKKEYFTKDQRDEADIRFDELEKLTKEYFHDRAKPQFDQDENGIFIRWMEPNLSGASLHNLLALSQEYDQGIAKDLGYKGAKFGDEVAVYDSDLVNNSILTASESQIKQPTQEGKVDGEPVTVKETVEQPKEENKGAEKKETLTPISKVKDTPVAKTEKILLPPNPQLPIAKWWKEVTAFALQKVQAGKSRAEFISDMDENLHYDVVDSELGDVWKGAQADARRIAAEVKKAEKASKPAKITQKQFADTKTEVVKSSELIKQLFRVQQRASQQGRRAGINEIKQKIRDFKGGANELVGEFRNQMEDLRGATKLERSNLKNAVANIKLAQTPEAQLKAFDQAIDMLHATFESINERTPRYEYTPFPDAVTESGVDKNSKYQDVRTKFLEYGGQPEIRSSKEMLNFLNGTDTQAAGRFIAKEIESMKGRDERMKGSKFLRTMHKMHQGGKKNPIGPGRYNMFDFLGHISRGMPDSNLSLIRKRLADDERTAGFNMKELQDKAAELNPKGKATPKVMNTKVTIDTPVGKKKVGLGEIIMIDMALETDENVKAMENNDFKLDQGGRTFRATKAEYQAMVDQALSQVDADVKAAYEASKVLYEAIVNMSGDMVSPVANQIMKDLGLEQSFKKVNGKYVPIVLGDISVGDAIEIEIPDGAGGVETQKVADNYINREIHKGKYKERVGGSKGGVIRVGNLDSVLSHIMDSSADFAAKGITNNDMLKLLNNKQLKTQINRTFGTHFSRALMEKAYQTTGNAKSLDRTTMDRALSKAFSIVDPYRLSRPSTGLIMASSAQMVRPFLNNKESFQLGLKHGGSKFIQDIIKNDGFTYSRYSGRSFSPELAEQGAKIKTRSGGSTGETRASKFISWGDKGAISVVYAATAFDEMISRGLGSTMDDLQKQDSDFWNDVGNRVAYETMRTQPSGTSAAVSVWKGRARDKIGWRLLTRYGSQGSRIYNNVVDALDEYAYNPSENNRQQLQNIVESQMITNTAILSGIKATRRPVKIAAIILLMRMMGKDDDEIEEMKKKRDEEIDKMLPTFFANFARTELRSIEGVDDLMTFMDFINKPYVDDPFSGVMTSELRDVKDAVTYYKTALKWDKILRDGEKEKNVNGRDIMMPITGTERRRYEENYQNAIEKVIMKTRGLALIMSRLPLAALEDVSFGEDMIAEKVVESRID